MQKFIQFQLKLLCQFGAVFGLALSQQQASFGATLSSLSEGLQTISSISGPQSNGGETYNCNPQITEYVNFGQRHLRIDCSCNFSYSSESTSMIFDVKNNAGSQYWREFVSVFRFFGESDKNYEAIVDLSSIAGSASASASGVSASATAISAVANAYVNPAQINGKQVSANSVIVSSTNTTGAEMQNYPNTASGFFGGGEGFELGLGTYIGGYVETSAGPLGSSSAYANMSFIATATIREIANTDSGGGIGIGCITLSDGTEYCPQQRNSGVLQSFSENSSTFSSNGLLIIKPLPISELPPLVKTPEPSIMGGIFLVPVFIKLRRKQNW
jgi:hypothetical protein